MNKKSLKENNGTEMTKKEETKYENMSLIKEDAVDQLNREFAVKFAKEQGIEVKFAPKKEVTISLNDILKKLHRAIELDKNYYNIVRDDNRFEDIRKEVDALLDEITEEVRARIENLIIVTDEPLHKMYNWFERDFCADSLFLEYKQTCKSVADTKGKLKFLNYYECNKSLNNMEKAKSQLIHYQQIINENIKDSESRIKSYPKFREENGYVNEYSGLKTKIYYSIGFVVLFSWLSPTFPAFLIISILSALYYINKIMGVAKSRNNKLNEFDSNRAREIEQLKQRIAVGKLSI